MRYIVSIILTLSCLAANALQPVKWNQRYQDYIDKYKDVAIYEMLIHKIPASITLAQGLLESSAGNSDLSRKGNNHFGIKCHDWKGRTMHHDDDARGECFRVYESAFDSYEDHSRFLQRTRYKKLFSLKRTDYAGWARGLKECGYATNPKYAQLLIDIIRCYNLDAFDRATAYDEANLRKISDRNYLATIETTTKNNVTGTTFSHEVRMNNRNYYVVARNGDTFRTIAAEFDVSYKKIAKYNERDANDVLSDGDIVYLEKKRSRADKQYKGVMHTVKYDESMYHISQMYGIKLKSLYKMNNLSYDYDLKVNDRIRVY